MPQLTSANKGAPGHLIIRTSCKKYVYTPDTHILEGGDLTDCAGRLRVNSAESGRNEAHPQNREQQEAVEKEEPTKGEFDVSELEFTR